jgi:PKD repeat protein
VTVEPAATGPGPVVGDDAPTDPDGDGLFEDVNGDGNATGTDVTALFTNIGSPAVQDNPSAFDFNGDGQVTGSDVTALFTELAQGGT